MIRSEEECSAGFQFILIHNKGEKETKRSASSQEGNRFKIGTEKEI